MWRTHDQNVNLSTWAGWTHLFIYFTQKETGKLWVHHFQGFFFFFFLPGSQFHSDVNSHSVTSCPCPSISIFHFSYVISRNVVWLTGYCARAAEKKKKMEKRFPVGMFFSSMAPAHYTDIEQQTVSLLFKLKRTVYDKVLFYSLYTIASCGRSKKIQTLLVKSTIKAAVAPFFIVISPTF